MRLRNTLLAALAFASLTAGAFSQESSTMPRTPSENTLSSDISTIRGCLDRERGNYILIENGTSMVYALKGVGNKLDKYVHHEVEVKGKILPGVTKTGVKPEKSADNPSDSLRAVSGIAFQVPDVTKDVRMVSKHCKAADSQ